MSPFQHYLSRTVFGAAAFLLSLLVSFSVVAESPIRLVTHPGKIQLTSQDPVHGILVTAIFQDGRQFDVTARSIFRSRNDKIASVNAAGVIQLKTEGQTQIEVQFLRYKTFVPVESSESATPVIPSFKQDVIPVLTKFGCSSGGCHGKLAGQNGFKLSLRGYAPEMDIDWLRGEVKSRRLDLGMPHESLLLLKASGGAPHEGGMRFSENSSAYETLKNWIAARAPGPIADETDCERLEILPGNRTLRVGDKQQLLVRAHYANGRVRDVTWLAQFYSNEQNTIKVSEHGEVIALRHGETSIRAHFQGQVEILTFTVPYENKIQPVVYKGHKNFIDKHVFAKLEQLKIPPSPDADDAAFLRRVFLDATGRLPSPEQAHEFLSSKNSNKRSDLVKLLVESEEFTDFWTLQLSDVLQNRKERDHDVRGAKGVKSFHAWLRSQVATNKGWADISREVLTARGDVISTPQIGYFITTIGEKQRPEESEVPESVAQSFLGTRIGCAKCHNHPLEKYTQDDYYHFAAFFSRVSLKRQAPAEGNTELIIGTRDEQNKRKQIAETEKKLKESESISDENERTKKVAENKKRIEQLEKEIADARTKKPGVNQPRTKQFLSPRPLDRANLDFEPGSDLREQLAQWITNPENENFSGAMVNRLWKHFFAVGLVENVDDLRASNPPSNPELWKALNAEFVKSNFDLRHLMKAILNSRTYQLSSRTLPENQNDNRFYSHYYARRLPAEVLQDCISQATGVPDKFTGYPEGTRAVQLPEPAVNSYFLTIFGRSERVTACACERNGDVTLPQLLHLQNAEEIQKKISSEDGNLAGWLKESEDQLVSKLFLATYSRLPKGKELETFKTVISSGEDKKGAYHDLFWALLNSKEFAFNH